MNLLFLRVDGNLDSNLPSSNLLALEKFKSLPLLVLGANVDKSISLGTTRSAPATTDDTSRVDVDAGRSKEFGESGIVNGEAEIGNEEHRLGGFASRSLTDGADRSRGPRGLDFLGFGLGGRSGESVVITGSSCITLPCLVLFSFALEANGK
jgi:hypothetical protein